MTIKCQDLCTDATISIQYSETVYITLPMKVGSPRDCPNRPYQGRFRLGSATWTYGCPMIRQLETRELALDSSNGVTPPTQVSLRTAPCD